MNKKQIKEIIKESRKQQVSKSGVIFILKNMIKEEFDNRDKDPKNKKKREEEPEESKKLLYGGEDENEMLSLGGKFDKDKRITDNKNISEGIEDSLRLIGSGDAHYFCVEFIREESGKAKPLSGVATIININSKEEAEASASSLLPEPVKFLKICSPARVKDSIYLIDGKNKKVIEI